MVPRTTCDCAGFDSCAVAEETTVEAAATAPEPPIKARRLKPLEVGGDIVNP